MEDSRQSGQRRLAEIVVEHFNDGVCLHDMEGRITFVNRAICELTGYTQDRLLETSVRDLQSDAAKKGSDTAAVPEAMSEIRQMDTVLCRKDGTTFPAEVFTRLVEVEQERLVLLVIRDITEQKKAEIEKAKLETQLSRSQKLETIGTLAGGIAHDFNNMLTPIMGYTEMALTTLPEDNPLFEDLQEILVGAKRAKELVAQILTFSRQLEQDRKPLQLYSVVTEALKLLRPSIPSTIEIREQIDRTCPGVVGDASQLHQVIVNLCTNAYQAMTPKGGVLTIGLKPVIVDGDRSKLLADLSAGSYVQLTVSDTGVGMDHNVLDRIFEPFFTTKPVDQGTGMGLSVVHGIVTAHGAAISVTSEQGVGTTFQVLFPPLKRTATADQRSEYPMKGGDEAILVVDDEVPITNVIKRILGRAGYRVVTQNDGVNALKMFLDHPGVYDIVVTDLTMPNMTGMELARHMHEIRPELPIIVMTGYGDNVSKEIKHQPDIQGFIGKPLEMRELISLIRQVLDAAAPRAH